MNKYIEGNLIDDIATFTEEDNVTPVDPSFVEVDWTVLSAGTLYGPYYATYGSATVPANGIIARLSPGKYEVQMDTTLLPGYWTWQWYGSGGTASAQALLPLSAIVLPAPILYPFEP